MTERFKLVENDLGQLLEEKKFGEIRKLLMEMNPSDVATLFAAFEAKQLPVLFRLLPKELAAESFAEMEPEDQQVLIHSFSDNELKQVLDELYADDAAALVEEMPANVVKRVLKQANPQMRASINLILQYPENSAGSMMTTEFVALRPSMTVEESILRIRQQGVDKETIYTCYVTQGRKLLGLVTVKDLLLCNDDSTLVRDVMEQSVISVTTHTDREEVARMLSHYNFLALPVVDLENRMVGIVTFDDAMDVLEEEVTEDMALMGGVLPSEKTYLKSSVWTLFQTRIPWLLLLMVSATFTGMIITAFEEALAAQAALIAFIPMLMGTGGNSGSQASVTVIRALSLGELHLSDLPKVIWKEIRTAVLCGAALSAACFLKLWLVDSLLLGHPGLTLAVNAVVSLALCATVLLAKLIGATLPLVAKALKLDPAVMASPFITTVVDTLSLLVYFLFADLMLGI